MNFLELFYYLGLTAKKHAALKNQKRLPYRVISIGNITVGGTGKTPATLAVAEEAKRRGFQPVILTRGYRGTARGPCFVTRGDAPLLAVREAGDEPYLMAQRLQGVPIVKGKDRYEAGMFSLQEVSGHKPGSGGMHDGDATRRAQPTVLFLLDDGFQHWRLYRDRDIVLIDAGDPFGNGRLLPKGRLREPLSALARADVIVLTKAGMDPAAEPDALIQKIRRYNDHAPVHASAHAPVCVMSPSGKKKPVAWLRGKRVFGFCGLGNPESFRKTLMASGSELGGFRVFRDHYQYRAEDIAALAAEARSSGSSWIVTTAKDMVRLGSLDLPENILIIEIEFSADRSFYEDVFAPG